MNPEHLYARRPQVINTAMSRPSNGARRSATRVKDNVLPPLPLDLWHLICIVMLMGVVMMGVVIVERRLPVALTRADEPSHSGTFIAQRAMDHLRNLTSIGPRVTGSYENEVQSVNLLIAIVKDIRANAALHHSIEVDVQRSSGAFPLTFLDGMINAYRNVQSVVVKLSSDSRTKHALLLNCHFDTVPDSPGASDDGAGCAVMLEVLRVMSTSQRLLRHNVIFLFNGAEENIMQASHGFITQHKWASQVRAFINLEACGAGGREVLFQAGPHSPWIVETYSESVPYPYASSLAQEIFESGLIPGDTDFRIFRDFGKVSGLDFAWSANGYVYHTEFDTIKQIPPGTLQRTGDNILALTTGLASGQHLSDIQTREGQPVFFDLLGAFVVRFPIGVAGLVSVVAISLCCAHVYLNMAHARKKACITREAYLRHIRRAIIILSFACVSAVLVCVGIAALLAGMDRSMAWFSKVVWLGPLYVAPGLAAPASIVPIAARTERKNPLFRGWLLTQIYADAQALQWAALLILCVMLRVRSGFVPLLWVVSPAVAGLLRHALMPNQKGWPRLVWYVAGVALPFVQTCYLVLGSLDMFIPIMGRVGASLHTEIVTAVLVSTMFLIVSCCWIPLVLATNEPWPLIKVLYGIVLVSLGIITLTGLGFPYSAEPYSPAPQRFMLAHTRRTIHSRNGDSEVFSGYWIPNLDAHSPYSVEMFVPEMKKAVQVSTEDCSRYLYCGAPYYLPVLSFISKTHWLPAPPPSSPDTTSAEFTHERVDAHTHRIHCHIAGPNHIGILLSPVADARITNVSLTGTPPLDGPMWGKRRTHFIYTADAHTKTAPWVFYVDIKHNFSSAPPSWLDVVVNGYYLFGEYKEDERTKNLVAKFPPWTTVSAWTAHTHLYTV